MELQPLHGLCEFHDCFKQTCMDEKQFKNSL